jgi:hypothetical protein
MHIGTTKMCIIAPYVSIPILVHAAFDTLVFFAISFRIISFSIVGDTFSARMMSFFRGQSSQESFIWGTGVLRVRN